MFRLFSTFHSQLFYSLEYFLFIFIFFGRKDEEKKEFSMKKKIQAKGIKTMNKWSVHLIKKYYSAQKDQITSAN